MRQSHCRVTLDDIQSRAMQELSALLPWTAFGPLCSVEMGMRILWLLSTLRTSLSALCHRFRLPYGQTHLRRSLTTPLPKPAALASAFSRRLQALIPPMPRKGFDVAIDTHWSCYYGRPAPGVVGGQRKNGTRRFFVYATAVIVEKGRRYTLALSAPESNRPREALEPLLDQIAASGIRVRTLLLDKAFYATEVFQLLLSRRVPHLVAVPHRRPHFRELFGRHTTTAAYTLQTRHRRGQARQTVKLKLIRVQTTNRDKSISEQVFAHHGLRLRGNAGEICRRRYKSRFGIESSYRQLNQAKARTTTRDRRWRLLLVGLSLLFRQLWVFLESAVHKQTGQRWSAQTGLERLRTQLAQKLTATMTDNSELTIGQEDARLLKRGNQ